MVYRWRPPDDRSIKVEMALLKHQGNGQVWGEVHRQQVTIMKMKTRCMAMMGAIMVTLSLAGLGKADDRGEWVWYAQTEMGDSYYDKSSIIKVGPTIIRVLHKDKYSETGKEVIVQSRKKSNLSIEGYDKLDYVLDHLELDCAARSIKDIGFLEYDREDRILYGFEYPAPRTIPVLPGTPTDTLLKTVCP
jgi:hypothetical protein